ncbi:TSUP family transporter [Yinghuangia seranimata]|uniref:TSUP family transporter n=1 Tax=Yinghuangia seranimata TaxID=408067 RepID=UPI00248CCEC2|nr:TSUP family transporter [Yinghuangia seranimata]MDI2125935.1 TSUP family transporter [Yinghuangia seranimata]
MELLAVASVVLVAAALQRATGLGFGLVAGPGLVVLLGPAAGVGASNAAAGAISAAGLAVTWRRVRLRAMLPLVAAAVVTVPVGASLVRVLPEPALLAAIGAVVVAAVAVTAAGIRVRSLKGRRGAVAAGAASGVMNAAAGVGGPPVALYAVNAGWQGPEFVANAQFYGVLVNAASLAARGTPDLSTAVWLWCAGAVAAGITLGQLLARRLPAHRLTAVVLALAFAGGAGTLAKGLLRI